jgi:hypothetical protein
VGRHPHQQPRASAEGAVVKTKLGSGQIGKGRANHVFEWCDRSQRWYASCSPGKDNLTETGHTVTCARCRMPDGGGALGWAPEKQA